MLSVHTLSYGEIFTYIALTDTHTGLDTSRLNEQVSWIIENKELKNIKFVTHSGDFITSYSTSIVSPHDRYGCLICLTQAASEMRLLTLARMPNLMTPGNHDYYSVRSKDISTYKEAFPISDFENESWFGDVYRDMANNYGFFSAGGIDFLVMGLEYMPKPNTIKWANKILSTHSDKMVILFTHSYSIDGDYDNRLYTELISNNSNIFLVTAGHSLTEECRIDSNSHGVVNQVISNYQFDQRFIGCENTHFRVYTINTETGNIRVESYSACAGYDRTENASFELNMYKLNNNNLCDTDISCGQ